MEAEYRFVLLDFGPPMDSIVQKNIINSLENVLALGLTFPRHSKKLHFGISVLNSDFTILYSESVLRKNYYTFTKSMKSLLKTASASRKVTVQKYKQLLNDSIKKIIYVSEEKCKTENVCIESKCIKIKVALLTKKIASIMVDILASVIKKLFENFTNETLKQTFKIVQILNEPEEKSWGVSESNTDIKWMTCTDSICDLNFFFKDWFLRWKHKLQIRLSSDLDFKLQCEVDDFIINPVSVIFDEKYDSFNEVPSKTSSKDVLPDILEPVYDLEIINRISVSSLWPTFVFGIPRNIRASRNSPNWTESQMNEKLFKELCWEMSKSEEGLLTKSMAKIAANKVTTYHFLISDRCGLLMHDITTEELYLPKRLKIVEPFTSDECAASLIKNCIQKIEFLHNYSPVNFSSGLYQCLRNLMLQGNRNKNLFGNFNPENKLFGKKCEKKGIRSSKNKLNDENGVQSRKRPKPNAEKEFISIHPALLPAEVVTKYRKMSSCVFNLPELSEDFIKNLK